jgi:Ca2+/H+ antiporter, TMEM165/GDT1 family
MINWIHTGPTVTAAFLASLVECVEALTIVLAVGTVRGWRSALLGTAGGLAALAALVAVLGPALGVIPITVLQLGIGLLLLLFGLSWLRKAVLRAAGIMPLHDERRAFAATTAALTGTAKAAATSSRWDAVAMITAFKAVVLEGIEVVFIVLTVGAAHHMIVPASLGAAGAVMVVTVAALAVRRPLARVPENTLKFAVGVLLASFGAFWVGEGLGFPWPGADLSIVGLAAMVLTTCLLAIAVVRSRNRCRSAAA